MTAQTTVKQTTCVRCAINWRCPDHPAPKPLKRAAA